MKTKTVTQVSAHVAEVDEGLIIQGILFPGLDLRLVRWFQDVMTTPNAWEALAALQRLTDEEKRVLLQEEV